MKHPKNSGSNADSPRTRQVCSLVQQALSSALASSFDNPILHSMYVQDVLPAPSVARLLVVVAPTDPETVWDGPAVLDALDQARSLLRQEVAAELNRKRTPELTFTLAANTCAHLDPTEEELHVTKEHGGHCGAHAVVHTRRESQKRAQPRNQKRTLRRQARTEARKANIPAPTSPDLSQTMEVQGGVPVRCWTRGVVVEPEALTQLAQMARLPIVADQVLAMPDVHVGTGATVGSVIPTRNAVIPAAVGVDIGCGMCAVRTTLQSWQLPDSLRALRQRIEAAVPHGTGRSGSHHGGGWKTPPESARRHWELLKRGFVSIVEKHPKLELGGHPSEHLGSLGGGNHFIELCIDESEQVWIMLHSGSRGVGNRIGRHFIQLARQDMQAHIQHLPDKQLAYFSEGNPHFDDYVEAVNWAQDFAQLNRKLMLETVLCELRAVGLPEFTTSRTVIDCHHNYVNRERHGGEELWVTRKGAVSAGKDQLGIIPGSMGARSFIVRGKGNERSLCSCSHGAGRRMSRSEARKRYTVSDHVRMTEGVECRKDRRALDETPGAYKDIARVMAAQADLVSVEHTLKQVLCIKG